MSKAPAQAGSPRAGCSGPCPDVDRVRSWAWGSLCPPAVPAGLGRRGDSRAEAVPEGSREGTMRRGVHSWACPGALMAAPPLLLSCRSAFRWQRGRQPQAWKRRRRYRGEGGLSWQGQGGGCQCWVRAPQQPRAAAGLGRTLGYGVCDGGASGDPPVSWLCLCCTGDLGVGLQAQQYGFGEGGGMSDPHLCVWGRRV